MRIAVMKMKADYDALRRASALHQDPLEWEHPPPNTQRADHFRDMLVEGMRIKLLSEPFEAVGDSALALYMDLVGRAREGLYTLVRLRPSIMLSLGSPLLMHEVVADIVNDHTGQQILGKSVEYPSPEDSSILALPPATAPSAQPTSGSTSFVGSGGNISGTGSGSSTPVRGGSGVR